MYSVCFAGLAGQGMFAPRPRIFSASGKCFPVRRWMALRGIPMENVLENGITEVDLDGAGELLERPGTSYVTRTRTIVLNRPKALNALTESMCKKMFERFLTFEKTDQVHTAIIRSSSAKAFCAGGDVRTIAQEWSKGNVHAPSDFFRNEYKMNNLLGNLRSTRLVAFIHGITMGGGAGVSVHGKYRIATETTVFAMPECAIGICPDIGSSYFLSRLPFHLGRYLGLTGNRLTGAAVVASGLATHFVPSVRLDDLEEQISLLDTKDGTPSTQVLENVLDMFSENVEALSGYPTSELIDRCFSKDTVEEIVAELLSLKSSTDDTQKKFAEDALRGIQAGNPVALKIALELQKRGQSLSLTECLEMEFAVSTNLSISSDFHEGVRAALIDKDKNPTWTVPTLDAVGDVDKYFKLPEDVTPLFD